MSRPVLNDNFLVDLRDTATRLASVQRNVQRVQSPAVYLDTQILIGNGRIAGNPDFVYAVSGNSMVIDAVGTPLAISYSPLVDSHWEVTLNIGALQCVSRATFNQWIQARLNIVPSPYSGVANVQWTMTPPVGVYDSVGLTKIFEVSGGTTYTVTAQLYFPFTGSVYFYDIIPDQLSLHGKAWSR